MSNRTILILGAGIGGIVTARELRKHLGNQHRIVLVDRSPIHSFPPSFLWVMLGWRKPMAIQKPLSLLEKYGIEFHHASIEAIHPEKKRVDTDRSTFNYDWLVITLGSELAPQAIPGLTESAYTFYTLEQAEKLGRTVPTFLGGTVAIVIAELPYKCPPAPYEASLLLESFFTRKGTNRVKIKVFTPEPMPLAVAGPDTGRMIGTLLQQRGIDLYIQHKLVSVDLPKKQLSFENGTSTQFDLLIAVPPHRASHIVQAAHLTNDSGWIPVDRAMRTQHPNIFALGDITTVSLPSGLSLPKAGVFAVNGAEVVAYNIAREIQGHGSSKECTGIGYCFLETGNGRAGYLHGNFFSNPFPTITIHEPSVTYHWGKVVFEKYWLWRWF